MFILYIDTEQQKVEIGHSKDEIAVLLGHGHFSHSFLNSSQSRTSIFHTSDDLSVYSSFAQYISIEHVLCSRYYSRY